MSKGPQSRYTQLTPAQIRRLIDAKRDGVSTKDVCRRFGVAANLVNALARGKMPKYAQPTWDDKS